MAADPNPLEYMASILREVDPEAGPSASVFLHLESAALVDRIRSEGPGFAASAVLHAIGFAAELAYSTLAMRSTLEAGLVDDLWGTVERLLRDMPASIDDIIARLLDG